MLIGRLVVKSYLVAIDQTKRAGIARVPSFHTNRNALGHAARGMNHLVHHQQDSFSRSGRIGGNADGIEQIAPFAVCDYELSGRTIRISRMGFTADLGYECWMKPELADAFMQSIESVRLSMDIALPGYGLSALQACRLEGGFIVAGWDFATELEPQPGFERSPYELGLGWLVNLDAADFVGRDALLEQKKNGYSYTLRSFSIDEKNQPDDGTEIFSISNDKNISIGIVNCSSWSWGLNKMIGNASIRAEHVDLTDAWIPINGKRIDMKLSSRPPVSLERRNQIPAPIDA